MPQGDGKPYTGGVLIDAYQDAIRASKAGDPDASAAMDGFDRELSLIAMRPDSYGLAARRARADFGLYFESEANGVSGDPKGFINENAHDALSTYLVNAGDYESQRRYDLLGVERQPTYQGGDGKFYVDAAGTPHEIPLEWARQNLPALIQGFHGETPHFGEFAAGMPVALKAGDYLNRAIETATSSRKWEEVPSIVDVATADPAFPFATQPQFSDDLYQNDAILQDPVKMRAIEDALAEAHGKGQLDIGVFGHILKGAGFLTEFAAATKGIGAAGKGLSAAAKLTTVGKLAVPTAEAAEAQTAVQSGLSATRPAINVGFQTVRDFAGYHVLQDAMYGRINSVGDVASSGLAGAKEGAIMVGAGLVAGIARNAVLGALSSKALDPVTKDLAYRFGPAGKMFGAIYDTARGRETVDQLAKRMAGLSDQGKGLREMLVRYGWDKTRAQMAEHMIDSAAVGLAFGAYNDAQRDPGYEGMNPWQRTARMVKGLTSAEAIGGASAFAGSVLAHGYANKIKWGKQWENAPLQMRAELEQRVQNIVTELAQPSNHELTDSFRQAFDLYRERDPKAFDGIQFSPKWEQDLRQALAAGQDLHAELLGAQGPAAPSSVSTEKPPETPVATTGTSHGPPTQRPTEEMYVQGGAAEEPAGTSAPAVGETAASPLDALATEALQDPTAFLAKHGAQQEPAPARTGKSVQGQGAELMRSIGGAADLETVNVADLKLSPGEFQYKGGTSETTGELHEGPLSKLKSREEFDPTQAGGVVVYERASGERVVVDGHQRVNAAKRLSQGGKPIELGAYVLREEDGITPQMARAYGALRNLRAGSGTAVDAAKVARDLGWGPKELKAMGARGSIAEQSAGLSGLSEPVFSAVVNGQVDPQYAAEIGRYITDPAKQLAAVRAMSGVENVAEAASIARQIANESAVSTSQGSLFGETGDVLTMVQLRAKILGKLEPMLAADKRFAGAMERHAERAKSEGIGEIDKSKAREMKGGAAELAGVVKLLADKQGTAVNEVLTRAAEALGKNALDAKEAARWTLEELHKLHAQGGLLGEGKPGAEGLPQPGGPTLFASQQEHQDIGFLGYEARVEPLSFEKQKTWLNSIQNLLYPITDYRNERVAGLVKRLVTTFGLKADEAEVAVQLMEAHADVWAKSHGKTAEDWYRERIAGFTNAPTPLGSPEGARAATTFLADGRAVLHALEQPKVSDLMHELAHVWRHDLQGKHAKAIESWLNVKDGNWTVRAEEKFAQAFERYMRTGKAPTDGLKGAFESMRKWFRNIYQRIRGTGLDVKMDASVRRAMDSLFQLPKLDEDMVVRERLAKLTAETKGEIYRANRNKPQYVGHDIDTIVAHELRGGLPDITATPAIKQAQAGDSIREATEILKAHGCLPAHVPFEHPLTARSITELARGGDAYRDKFQALDALDAFNQAVDAAKRAKVQMREIAGSAVAERFRPKLGLLFEYLDVAHQGGTLDPALKKRLIDGGLMDKKTGRVDRLFTAAMGKHVENQMAIDSLAAISDPRLIEPSAAARPWVAFNYSPWEFRETALARAMKLRTLVDKKIIPPTVLRRLQKIGVAIGGVWQNNAVDSINNATNKSAAMHVFHKWETAVGLLQGHGEEALARIAARFGGQVPPNSHMKLLNWAIDSGALMKMKGPQDFEQIRQGTGYLFEIARDVNDILTRLGQAGVHAQFFAPEQVEKWGGKYRPHLYLQIAEQDTLKELREGRMPTFAARNLSRGQSPENEAKHQIEDPFHWLTTVTHQEGKAIQYLGVLQDLLHGGYVIDEKTLKSLSPYDQAVYERVAVNPETEGKSVTGGPSRRNWIVLSDMLLKQQDPNNPAPKSKQLERTLSAFLGQDERGPRYMTRQALWELDALTGQLFNPPSHEGWIDQAVYQYEQATRAFRRGLTIGRPKHWTLNILNSVGTNHVLDRLPMSDVVSSAFTGNGYYADAMRDITGLVELAKLGNPKEKPENWTLDRWDRVNMLQEAFQSLNGTTFTGIGLEGAVVVDALSSCITPDMQSAALMRDLEARGQPIEAATKQAVFDMARRYSGGMAEFDRRLHQMLGSHDAQERARGIANFTAMYQLWEMSFKWAATLRTLDTQPAGISLDQAVRWSAVGTADYSNTSPLMRSFNTSHSAFNNPLFRMSEGKGGAWGRAIMREALKGRFWMYSSAMGPALAASVFSHPLRAATVLAVASTVTGAINALAARDPDEDRAFQEALRGSLSRAGAPLFDEQTLDQVKKMDLGAPNVTGAAIPHEHRGLMANLWDMALRGNGLMFQAPGRQGQTRLSNLEDLSPGYGSWIGAAHGAQNMTHRSASDHVTSLLDAMSVRGMELSIALANGGFGLAKAMSTDDPKASYEMFKGVRQAAADVLPTMSPFFLASRDGQRLVEVAALNGQNIDEYARGIVPASEESAPQNLGELMFSTMWRSERLMQPQFGGVTEREALDAIIGRLFPDANPSRGAYWDKLKEAQSDVHYQLSEILSGTYKDFTDWGHSIGTYDSMLVPALFGKDGPMRTLIAREPDPERQQMMTRYVDRFLSSEEWNRSLGLMMRLARGREMRPDFFRLAVTNAMKDPTGEAMLNWLDDKVVRHKPDPKAVPDYAAAFFHAVVAPKPGTERYNQWSQVLKRLHDFGYSPQFTPDNAVDALRRLGVKPELAGMPALREAAMQR